MKAKIHKFEQNGTYILLDINSGAVHVVDKMIYDMMDIFDGSNDDAVVAACQGSYPESELRELENRQVRGLLPGREGRVFGQRGREDPPARGGEQGGDRAAP